MTRKYLESLDQEGGDVVEGGAYTIEVVDARALEDKPFLWIDLKIEGGPDDGRVVTVGLNIPDDDASRGAIFHFKKKIRAFSRKLLEHKVFELPDEEQPARIAELLIGERADVTLSVQEEGQYKGSQQLDETDPPPESAAPAAKPEPVVEVEKVDPTPAEPASVAAAPAAEDDLPF